MSETHTRWVCALLLGIGALFPTLSTFFESRLHDSICVKSAGLLRAELIFLQENEMKLQDV
jgi:hypothetical protein